MKRTHVNAKSKKRIIEDVQRAQMMLEQYGERPWLCRFQEFIENIADDDPYTVRAGDRICHGEVNGHEIIKASAWRAGRLVPSNVTTLCDFHNGWVEDHPIEARAMGLSKRKEVE